MVWYLLALLSAVAQTTKFAFVKQFLKKVDPIALAAGNYFVGFLIMITISLSKGIPEIGPDFWFAAIIAGSIIAVSAVLYYKALELADLSLVIPMLAFSPVFLIFTSAAILGEIPSSVGAFGIILVFLGSYVINASKEHDYLHPVRQLFKNKGVLYALIVAFLYALGSDYGKVMFLNSDPYFTPAIFAIIASSMLFVYSLMRNNKVNPYKNNLKFFVTLGTLSAIEWTTTTLAYGMQIVPYIISIKRLGALYGVFLGYYMFKERDVKSRFLGALLMVTGALLIILF